MAGKFTSKDQLSNFILGFAQHVFDDNHIGTATTPDDLQIDGGAWEVFVSSVKNALAAKGCRVRTSAASIASNAGSIGDVIDAMAKDLGLN